MRSTVAILLQLSRFIFIAVLLTIGLYAVQGKPDRTPAPPLPKIAGLTNWGNLKQDGLKITISGHPHWEAAGEIRKDGKVHLLWTLLEDGRRAPAIYDIKGGDLDGKWNWGEHVTTDEKGNLAGLSLADRIYKLAPQN